MQYSPTVSVIIPTCNRTELLPVALKSLVRQTFRDFEVVVVNDGEEDAGPVLARFAKHLRIVAVEHEIKRQGLSASRNSGLRAARGRFLAYLDDDDFFYENHLEVLCGGFAVSNYQVLYSDALLARQKQFEDGFETVSRYIPLSVNFDRAHLAERNITPVLCVMHAKECLKRTRGFAPYLSGHEDWDLWQRLARHFPFRHLSVATAEYLYREGAPSLSSRKDTMGESWLFTRRQGLLFSRLTPVCVLEALALRACRLDPAGQARETGKEGDATSDPGKTPCRVSVILTMGSCEAFLAGSGCRDALDGLGSSIGDAELVLVGAGESLAGLYQRLAETLPRPPLCLRNDADVGRVIAANQGAAIASGEWLIFLEPDVAPPAGSGAWIDLLLAVQENDPGIGAAGGAVESARIGTFYGGVITSKGELRFNRRPAQFPAGEEADAHNSGSPLRVDCLSSHCFAVRRSLFLEEGGFDPAFAPGHYADADLCLRLKQRGLSCVVSPAVRLIWNRDDVELGQNPAGLVSRRTFWDTWNSDRPFSLERFTSGAEWSMRPEYDPPVWPSDGVLPDSFHFTLPELFR